MILLRQVANNSVSLLSGTSVVLNTTFARVNDSAKFLKPRGAQSLEPLFLYPYFIHY